MWVHSFARKAPVEIIVHELNSDAELVSCASHSDQQPMFKVVIMGDDEIKTALDPDPSKRVRSMALSVRC